MPFIVIPNIFTPILHHNVKPILLKDLIETLDRLDSNEIQWHVARGLPAEFQKGDSIVISGKNLDGTTYRQEDYRFQTNPKTGKPIVHRIRMDAPTGSGVILTDEQYILALKRKDVLKQKYESKIQKLKSKAMPIKVKLEKNVSLCMICRERYQNYEDVLLISVNTK